MMIKQFSHGRSENKEPLNEYLSVFFKRTVGVMGSAIKIESFHLSPNLVEMCRNSFHKLVIWK